MTDMTPRLALPLLAAGQAQKEIFHNEALVSLDALVQPVVQGFAVDDPPATPGIGQGWIVGAAPTGDWAGQAGALALWTDGGWRFVAAFEGLSAWVVGAGLRARYVAGAWTLGSIRATGIEIGGNPVLGARQPAIADASGGTVVDSEARAALGAILVALRTHGLIAV